MRDPYTKLVYSSRSEREREKVPSQESFLLRFGQPIRFNARFYVWGGAGLHATTLNRGGLMRFVHLDIKKMIKAIYHRIEHPPPMWLKSSNGEYYNWCLAFSPTSFGEWCVAPHHRLSGCIGHIHHTCVLETKITYPFFCPKKLP